MEVPETLRQRVRDHLRTLFPATARADRRRHRGGGRRSRRRRVGPARTMERTGRRAHLVRRHAAATSSDEAPLVTLRRFVQAHLRDAVSAVHVLPFFPYSSDDGFSVVDFRAVREDLGSWDDVEALAESCGLMADLVLNHVSSQSVWFEQFVADEEPGRSYLRTADPTADLSAVVRPRTTPLLRPVETAAGIRHLWCTFSADQIDLDYREPKLLCEMLGVVDTYVRRLDAAPRRRRLRGQAGRDDVRPSSPDARAGEAVAHAAQWRAPGTLLVTETNVPNRDNLKYFGQGDEAHLIYNFSLPPLVIDALLSGHSRHLSTWMMSMPPAPPGGTYLNFLASHDGIGIRPAEGLLSDAEIDRLIETVQRSGGLVSWYETPNGPRPYELNVALRSAFDEPHGGPDGLGLERFVCAHAIQFAIEGIPAVYVHSFLATPNDLDGVTRTGRARSINRSQRSETAVEAALADPTSETARGLGALTRLLRVRAAQPAFHPSATQFTLHLGPRLFGCWRQSRDRRQSIFAVSNVTASPERLEMASLNLILTDEWFDVLSGRAVAEECWELAPYETVWITNRPAGD
ncbi:MAG: alpha-amylase family glycosyl hydrolase [Ilumatobacteraceae bacterium]